MVLKKVNEEEEEQVAESRKCSGRPADNIQQWEMEIS